MRIESYGRQGRYRVVITRRDLTRLIEMIEQSGVEGDATVIVGLTPENDFSWDIPHAPDFLGDFPDLNHEWPKPGVGYGTGETLEVTPGHKRDTRYREVEYKKP